MEMSTHEPVTLEKREKVTWNPERCQQDYRDFLFTSHFTVRRLKIRGRFLALQPPSTSQPGAAAAPAHTPNLLRGVSMGRTCCLLSRVSAYLMLNNFPK